MLMEFFVLVVKRVMKVLRHDKDTLLTILEVFLHDPLYKWSISPAKVLLKQKEGVLARRTWTGAVGSKGKPPRG